MCSAQPDQNHCWTHLDLHVQNVMYDSEHITFIDNDGYTYLPKNFSFLIQSHHFFTCLPHDIRKDLYLKYLNLIDKKDIMEYQDRLKPFITNLDLNNQNSILHIMNEVQKYL